MVFRYNGANCERVSRSGTPRHGSAMSSAAFYWHDEDDPNLSRISAQRIKDHDNAKTAVEHYVSEFYDKQYGINSAYMDYGILLRLRQIAADSMMEYDKSIYDGTGSGL